MDLESYSDSDWQEVLDEFRLLVARAGYAEWDGAMADALIESDEEPLDRRPGVAVDSSSLDELRRYVAAFMRLLKGRTGEALDKQRRSLSSLLRTTDGLPVTDFAVAFGDRGGMRRLDERLDGNAAMMEELRHFLDELYGEDRDYWEGAAEADGGDR